MKKPKKTLKDLARIEGLLTKQTERSAKLLSRRKTGDAENPVTAGYYDRIAAHQAAALADLSEIGRLTETLSRQIVEADAAKDAKKAVKSAAAKAASKKAGAAARKPARKAAPAKKPRAKKTPAAAANGEAPAKRTARQPAAKSATA